MTDLQKTLIDIRDRAQLAIEGMRAAETATAAAEWTNVSDWYKEFYIGDDFKNCIYSSGGQWFVNADIVAHPSENAARTYVESKYVHQKRAALGVAAPAPEPLPTPLPCCGKAPNVIAHEGGTTVMCNSCHCFRKSHYPTEREAIERWNQGLAQAKSETLLPCPHCGHTSPQFAERRDGTGLIGISCLGCLAKYGSYVTSRQRAELVAAWNRRAPSQPDAVAKAATKLVEAAVAWKTAELIHQSKATFNLCLATDNYIAAKAAAGKAVQS